MYKSLVELKLNPIWKVQVACQYEVTETSFLIHVAETSAVSTEYCAENQDPDDRLLIAALWRMIGQIRHAHA